MTVKRKAAGRPTLVSIAVPYCEPLSVADVSDERGFEVVPHWWTVRDCSGN
jgi:hypothetical protein